MPLLQVTVDKLNKRNAIPSSFSDKSSVIGVVNQGFRFEGTQVTDAVNAAPGTWYKDRDGHFYWGNGLSLAVDEAPAPQTFQWMVDLGIQDIWSTYKETGHNVTIAVIDTGYNVLNADISPAVIGVHVLDPSGLPPITDLQSQFVNDTVGHGSFCAGVLAARNGLSNILGIAPASKLLVGKISTDGGLDPTGVEVILAGIQWAIGLGADIISVSFGKFPEQLPTTPNYLSGLQERFTNLLKDQKVLVFAACGDNPVDAAEQKENYPASFTGCISVGATDKGVLSPVTVISSKTIIHAQGVDVEGYGTTLTPAKETGTSMSTPIVAGVAALAVSFLKKKNNGDWNPADLLKAIYATGTPIKNSNGRKLINPKQLFQQL